MFLICQMTFMMFKKYAKFQCLSFSGSREKCDNTHPSFLVKKRDSLCISQDIHTKIKGAQCHMMVNKCTEFEKDPLKNDKVLLKKEDRWIDVPIF